MCVRIVYYSIVRSLFLALASIISFSYSYRFGDGARARLGAAVVFSLALIRWNILFTNFWRQMASRWLYFAFSLRSLRRSLLILVGKSD